MAEDREKSIATYSPQAAETIAENQAFSSERWGERQGRAYTEFLLAAVEMLAAMPTMDRRVAGDETLRSFIVRWAKARHGHRIVDRETKEGIEVVRILHSSMRSQDGS